MPTKFKNRITLSRVALVALVLFLGAGLKWVCGTPLDNKKFSQSDWLEGPYQNRAFMAYDLIENHLEPGMSEDEVLVLLGNPMERLGSNHSGESSETWVYWIAAMWLRTPGDDTYIYVRFDKSGSLVDSKIAGL